MTYRELRRSDLLDALFALEREEDINRVSRYFRLEWAAEACSSAACAALTTGYAAVMSESSMVQWMRCVGVLQDASVCSSSSHATSGRSSSCLHSVAVCRSGRISSYCYGLWL